METEDVKKRCMTRGGVKKQDASDDEGKESQFMHSNITKCISMFLSGV